jgi:hypothetical protein
MGGIKDVYEILIRKPEGKKPQRKLRYMGR